MFFFFLIFFTFKGCFWFLLYLVDFVTDWIFQLCGFCSGHIQQHLPLKKMKNMKPYKFSALCVKKSHKIGCVAKKMANFKANVFTWLTKYIFSSIKKIQKLQKKLCIVLHICNPFAFSNIVYLFIALNQRHFQHVGNVITYPIYTSNI